jgi:hypothetical protein
MDAIGFKECIDQFLGIANKYGIRPILVFFDDCWNPEPYPGKQPAPKPGKHNSGWWQSPGVDVVNDPKSWNRLENYIKDVLRTFRADKRILMWDLYNEPGNSKIESFDLVKSVFHWAREMNTSQPLTVGIWNFATKFKTLNEFLISKSDIITFHHYGKPHSLQGLIDHMQLCNRPLICTEWMARSEGSLVETNLPVFKKNNVGCINWGLVAGKTNTIYPWQTTWAGIKNKFQSWVLLSKSAGSEPNPWFHDLLRSDGSPYCENEIKSFRKLISNKE